MLQEIEKNNNEFESYILYESDKKTFKKFERKNFIDVIPFETSNKHFFIFVNSKYKDFKEHINLFKNLNNIFFNWEKISNLIIKLYNKNWTIYLYVDDNKLQKDIETITNNSKINNETFDKIKTLIVDEYFKSPNFAIKEPSLYLCIYFKPKYFDKTIGIIYGKKVSLDNSFFKDNKEYLDFFLNNILEGGKNE